MVDSGVQKKKLKRKEVYYVLYDAHLSIAAPLVIIHLWTNILTREKQHGVAFSIYNISYLCGALKPTKHIIYTSVNVSLIINFIN